jgi:hypothetical protein
LTACPGVLQSTEPNPRCASATKEEIMSSALLIVFVLSLPVPGIESEPALPFCGRPGSVPFDPAEVVRQVSGDASFDSTVFLLDTNVVYTASAQAQSYPAVAFDGEYYFVVWTDHRCSTRPGYRSRSSP